MVPKKEGKENGKGRWNVFLSTGNNQEAWLNRANVVTYKNSGKEHDDQVWKGHSKVVEDLNGFETGCCIHVHIFLLLLCLDHPIS